MFGILNKVKDIVNKVKNEVNDFLEENKKLEESEKLDEKRQQEAKLPWEGLKIISNSNGNVRDLIKEEILDLSSHEDNFLHEDSSYMFEFDFNMEEMKYQAIKIMEYDQRLGLLRNKLVPAKTSDEKFWKNYFYNVELIKMKHAIKAEEQGEGGFPVTTDEDDILRSDDNEEESKLNTNAMSSEGKRSQKDHNNSFSTTDKSKTFDHEHENDTENIEVDIKI